MSTQEHSNTWTVIEKKTKQHRVNHSTDNFSSPRNLTNSSDKQGTGRRCRYEPILEFASSEEKVKFTALKEEIPHIMMPGRIRRIAQKININALADRVLSDECIAFQRSGWSYVRVVKPNDAGCIPSDDDYDIIPLNNDWGDVVLFRRIDAM